MKKRKAAVVQPAPVRHTEIADLVPYLLGNELVAEGYCDREDDLLIFRSAGQEYLVEIKCFFLGQTEGR